MNIYLIWAVIEEESDAPWLVGAWDEYSVEGNYDGYMDAVEAARKDHGAGNVRVTTVLVDSDKVVNAFKPADVTPDVSA